MKKIPFEMFGNGQYMYMDIGRFIMLESLTGKPIGEILKNNEVDLGFTVKFLTVALRHHGNKQPQFYIDKIQEACETSDNDVLTDIQMAIVRAVAGSGVLGKAYYYAVFPEEMTEEARKDVESEKN